MANFVDNMDMKLNHLRKSKNRDKVIEILKNSNLPMSIEDIYLNLKQTNNSLALSTVYRIIDKLTSLNITQEAVKDGDRSLYELTGSNHNHYLMCTSCKKVVPLDICPIHEIEDSIIKKTGFKISGHNFQIFGECPECSKKLN